VTAVPVAAFVAATPVAAASVDVHMGFCCHGCGCCSRGYGFCFGRFRGICTLGNGNDVTYTFFALPQQR
jgi:hypothetical protein